MQKILITALLGATLTACASQAEWVRTDPRMGAFAKGAVLAQQQNCAKLRAKGITLSAEGDAICRKLGR